MLLSKSSPGDSPIGNTAEPRVHDHSVECSRIRIEAVADFEVRGGRSITVWPAAGAEEKDIEIFLFGPVWATLCYQRGLLPLHASAILTDGRITAFAGRSGAGKSTTAALMHALNYQLFADEYCRLTLKELCTRCLAVPSTPKAAEGFDCSTWSNCGEPVSERLDKDKYFAHPKHAADDKWSRLERLYLLEIDAANSQNSIDQLVGAEAVSALVEHTYHFDFVESSKRFNDHLAFCTKLASKIAIYRLRRSPLSGDAKEFGSFISRAS